MNFELTIKERKNLTEIFHLFISEFRNYVVSNLEEDMQWEASFLELLNDNQKVAWNNHRKTVLDPKTLIDFSHLKDFCRTKREILLNDVVIQQHQLVYQLPSYFDDLNKFRNKWAHFQEMSSIRYIQIITIIHQVAEHILKNKEIQNLTSAILNPQPGTDSPPTPPGIEPLRKRLARLINQTAYSSKPVVTMSNLQYANLSEQYNHWWIDTPPYKFQKDLYYALINEAKKEIHVLKINSNHFNGSNSDLLEVRNDNGYYMLYISASDFTKYHELKNKKYNFSSHLIKVIEDIKI